MRRPRPSCRPSAACRHVPRVLPATLLRMLLALLPPSPRRPALPASAGAVTGKFFAGTAIDGPSADIQSLGDLDVARDGTGALTYVKRVDGVDHVFVSRLIDGAFQAPEQIDAGLGGAGAQPVVAASDGGRLVVAFVSGGGVFAAVRPAGAPGWAATQQIAASGSDPDVDMSINGVAYLTWSTGGDVARRPARAQRHRFNAIPGPLDIDPAETAGTGTGRSKVAVAADGIATVVWGEAGHVYGRRIFELRLSTAPQDLGDNADAPDISSEDDSSFAWVVFRQGGLAVRAAPRRLGVRPADHARGHRGRGRAPGRDKRPRHRLRRHRRPDLRRRLRRGAQGRRLQPGHRHRRRLRGRPRRSRPWPRAATASLPTSRATRPAGARSLRGPTTTSPPRGP